MKRLAKITMILAVYLVWVCSNSVIALSCYANQSKHVHCCGKSCECHHSGCEKLHFESPHGCSHDHSNTIALYDTIKEDTNDIKPAEINIAAQIDDNIDIADVIQYRIPYLYERNVPLPSPPALSRCGMRAPPVVA